MKEYNVYNHCNYSKDWNRELIMYKIGKKEYCEKCIKKIAKFLLEGADL